jgi:hypothetical protein
MLVFTNYANINIYNDNSNPVLYETPIKKRKCVDVLNDTNNNDDDEKDDINDIQNNEDESSSSTMINTLQTKLHYAEASVEKKTTTNGN